MIMKILPIITLITSLYSSKLEEITKMMPFFGTHPIVHVNKLQESYFNSSIPANLFKFRTLSTKVPSKEDFVIGDTPAETLKITDSWEWYGDGYIVNDGVMIVDTDAIATIHGNIILMNTGELFVNRGTLIFPQSFTYQWSIGAYDSSRIEFHNSYMDFGHHSFTIGAIGARIIFDTMTVISGWITGTLFHGASIIAREVNNIGEWIYQDSCSAYISHADTLLNWFGLGEGDTAYLYLPSWDSIEHFVAQSDSNGFSGIDYSVVLDTIGFCMWGLFIDHGAYVDIRDSRIRTIGLYGTSTDTQGISGLVDSTYYADFTPGFTDRYIHISNSTIRTWSLYPASRFYLNLSSSIVGEILSMDTSTVWGENYFLDGSGGHFQSAGHSFNIAFFAAMTSEIYTTESEIAALVVTSIPVGRIWARNSSRIYMLQCQFPEKPLAYDSGLVYIMNIDGPTQAPVNELVPVFGTAEIVEGPSAPLDFDRYSLYWAIREDTTSWYPISENIHKEVYRDTLGYWNTTGLSEGEYLYRLIMWDTWGDSISMDWGVTLGPSSITEQSAIPYPELSFKNGKIVLNVLQNARKAYLKVFDVSGRLVRSLIDGSLNRGVYRFNVPQKPGNYIAKYEDMENHFVVYLKFQVTEE